MIDFLISIKTEVALVTRGPTGENDGWPALKASLLHQLMGRDDLERMLEFLKPLPNIRQSMIECQIDARLRTCIRRAITASAIKDVKELHAKPSYGRFS